MAQPSPVAAAKIPVVSVRTLSLVNFRNYQNANLKVEPRPVIIAGHNGSGKTNILEAISLLAPGRGIRNASLEELDFSSPSSPQQETSFKNSPWAINADISTAHGEINIGTARDTEGEKRIIKINGEKIRGQAKLGEYVSICYLTPQMDGIFIEGSTSRRLYLDRLTSLLMAEHTRHLAIYEHAKSERMKLLKTGRGDQEWLSVLEKRMAEQAVAIAAARQEAVDYLQDSVNEDSSSFPKAILAIECKTGDELLQNSAINAEENLKEQLKNNRRSDAEQGKTNSGIHKSDFSVRHADKGFIAQQCSTGEQKALLLSIALASVRAKAKWSNLVPVLLLDEVIAHLDDKKRSELIAAIEGFGMQCWMTGTDVSFFAGFQGKAQFFRVANSAILG